MRSPGFIAASFVVLTTVSCGGGGDKPTGITPVAYRSIELTAPVTLLTAIDDTVRLTGVAIDAAGARSALTTAIWKTSDAAILSVSADGLVRARGNGEATITVNLGSVTNSIALRVQQEVTSVAIAAGGIPALIKAIGVTVTATAAAKDRNGVAVLNAPITWATSDTAIASIDQRGVFRARKAGRASVVAAVGSITTSVPFEVATRITVPIDPYLATPIAGAKWEIPVVVVSYIPTADGVNVDVAKSPDFYVLNRLPLSTIENNILDIVRRKKMAVEQGSRFRGYKDATALPSLGIRVVSYINVYELLPPSTRPGVVSNTRLPDWFKVFSELGLDTLIRNRGVKQVWVSTSSFDASFPSYDPTIHNLADTRYMWESNMSSPTTGDISNSDRFAGDLPVLGHTYVVYGINFRRSQAEAIHNVGHHLEAQFAHVNQVFEGNTNLFWKSFVGQDAAGAFIKGRAGWTHMPPNTITNYDYLNATPAMSDIEDWRPDGTGVKKDVSRDTWGQLAYPWPGAPEFGQRVEAQWYVYWMQNMPGLGNTIPRGSGVMTNWWWFVADWDAAIRAGTGLATIRN
jgi:hypothetical protein